MQKEKRKKTLKAIAQIQQKTAFNNQDFNSMYIEISEKTYM